MSADEGPRTLPLRERHREAGAVLGSAEGWEVPRHYGDPPAEYGAATGSAAVFDRSHRGRLLVGGRSPRQMLAGTLTGSLPDPLQPSGEGVRTGRATESAALTPKGKTVSDLRVLPWWEEGDEESFLLDVPAAGMEGLRAHFRTYLPPRLAPVEEREGTAMITVVGPDAVDVLAEVLGPPGDLPAGALGGAGAGDVFCLGDDPEGALRVVGSAEVAEPAWDVLGPVERIEEAWEAVRRAGARPAGRGVWETLRIEAGRPLYGADLDDSTIPVEAGIHERVIDHGKGCYTGQEVIVRIRDRGRVNRHLRGLLLGRAKAPAPGTELYDDGGKEVGRVTSAAESPRYGQGVALGYVRREVEPGGRVRVGAPDGSEAEVRELGPGWGD